MTKKRRELDKRVNDGLEVRLLWSEDDDYLTVAVRDEKADESFELVVDRAEAVDAFHHPYAYAAFRGVDYREPWRQRLDDLAEAA